MKLAVILRGLPGSGKSTYAKALCDKLTPHVANPYSCIFATDDFFYHKGKYSFNLDKLAEYHNLNLARFIQAMQDASPLVICDNTNVCGWEFVAYERAALALGYQVRIEVVGEVSAEACKEYHGRNQHGVTLATLLEMADKFEL